MESGQAKNPNVNDQMSLKVALPAMKLRPKIPTFRATRNRNKNGATQICSWNQILVDLPITIYVKPRTKIICAQEQWKSATGHRRDKCNVRVEAQKDKCNCCTVTNTRAQFHEKKQAAKYTKIGAHDEPSKIMYWKITNVCNSWLGNYWKILDAGR